MSLMGVRKSFMLHKPAVAPSGEFSVADLFSAGEEGHVMDLIGNGVTGLWQNSTSAATAVTATTDPVGYVEPQYGTIEMQAGTDALRPVYTISGANNYLNPDGGNDRLIEANAVNAFKNIAGATVAVGFRYNNDIAETLAYIPTGANSTRFSPRLFGGCDSQQRRYSQKMPRGNRGFLASGFGGGRRWRSCADPSQGQT